MISIVLFYQVEAFQSSVHKNGKVRLFATVKDETNSVSTLLETAASLRKEADEMERELDKNKIMKIVNPQKKEKKIKMHPAVIAQRRVDARLETFESQLNGTSLIVRLGSALAYTFPAIELYRMVSTDYDVFPPDLFSFFTLFVLFNVGNEWTTSRLMRFATYHAILLDFVIGSAMRPTMQLFSLFGHDATFAPVIAFEMLLAACALATLRGQDAAFLPLTGPFIQRASAWSESEISKILTKATRKSSKKAEDDDDDAADKDDDDDNTLFF